MLQCKWVAIGCEGQGVSKEGRLCLLQVKHTCFCYCYSFSVVTFNILFPVVSDRPQYTRAHTCPMLWLQIASAIPHGLVLALRRLSVPPVNNTAVNHRSVMQGKGHAMQVYATPSCFVFDLVGVDPKTRESLVSSLKHVLEHASIIKSCMTVASLHPPSTTNWESNYAMCLTHR